MKEKYVDRINALGKVGGIVINVLKGITIAVMVLIIISYLLLDSFGKGIVSVNLFNKVDLSMDLREFGFIDSKKDKEEQKKYENFGFDENYKEVFDEPQAGFGKVVVGEFISTKLFLSRNEGDEYLEVDNLHVDKVDTYLIASLIYSIIIFISLIFAGRFFKALKHSHSPFGESVIKNMQKFAYSLIPWGLFGLSFSKASANSIKQYSVSMGLNFTTISVIIVILFLVYVFKYGALLQQESDETL